VLDEPEECLRQRIANERHQPANPMHARSIAADFDAPDPAIEALFGGEAT
jgi:hypothetical protein